jgi:hypothetical protein
MLTGVEEPAGFCHFRSSGVASRPWADFAILGWEAAGRGTSLGFAFNSFVLRSAKPLTMLLGIPAEMLQCEDTQSLVRYVSGKGDVVGVMIRRSHFVVRSRSVDNCSGCTIHRRAWEITRGLKDIDLRARRNLEMSVLDESATRWTVARGIVNFLVNL